MRSCLFFRELLRDSQDFLGHPLGKWSDQQFVLASRSVRFLNSGKPVLGKPAGQPDEGGPQTPMDVGNFSIYQSAHQNVGRTANRSREQEYIVSLRMCPPTTPQWFSCYHLSETRNAGACRLHGYPTFFDPRYGLLCVHKIGNRSNLSQSVD